jgi:hypothetical protein
MGKLPNSLTVINIKNDTKKLPRESSCTLGNVIFPNGGPAPIYFKEKNLNKKKKKRTSRGTNTLLHTPPIEFICKASENDRPIKFPTVSFKVPSNDHTCKRLPSRND